MMRRRPPDRQRGVTLIVLVTVLVLGIAWFTVGALGKSAPTPAERDVRTAAALRAAKDALLAYAAMQAADSSEVHPGRLPCPEHPNEAGTASEGIAQPRPPLNACPPLGRLPWKTLGIDQLRDGDGEPLWYAVATGTWAKVSGSSVLNINPGLGNQLSYDVSPFPAPNAVAAILAPGRPINTLSVGGAAPAGCAPISQQAGNRYTTPYNAANFLECGNEAGNYRKAGPAGWSNDRSISITAAEVMDAVLPSVADRLQRHFAPALNDWYNFASVASWGESFLPYASRFDGTNTPSNNPLCGTPFGAGANSSDGMIPTATVASGTCSTNWSGGSGSGIGPAVNCTPGATEMRCEFFTLLGGLLTPRLTLTAPNIGNSFRLFDRTAISVDATGLLTFGASTSNWSDSIANNGTATVSFDVDLPLLSIFSNVAIRIPNPTDAGLTDDRSRWFIINGWDRFTYYSVPKAVTVNPGGDQCRSSDTSKCLTVTNMFLPSERKRFALVLMGRGPLPGQGAWPTSTSPADYLEGENADGNDREFVANRPTSNVAPYPAGLAPFNDRLAACPHTLQTASGTLTVCGW